jgi:hypothetical protein
LGGLLSSFGAELTPPVTAAAPAEIGQTAAPSPRKFTTIATKPVVDSFGIIVHKNAVPDSFIVQFRDDMVVAKGQNLILNMGLAMM